MDEQVVVSTAASSGVVAALMATFGVFALVFLIAWYVLQVVAEWRIFTKAGRPGWHSLIPILNSWDIADMSWSRSWAWISICIPLVTSILSGFVNTEEPGVIGVCVTILAIVSAVLSIIVDYKLSKSFGKGIGFFLGLVFLNPIFKLILGFGDARYEGPQG